MAMANYALTLWLAKRPSFCCCCWCVSRQDALRTRRVFRFVRAIVKDRDEARRMQAEFPRS
jgi:hypothetical protein